ncbi:hypothetical protein BJV78DRAFT_420594 [Lactifluus subvellereus]|nr:hypothetical protein BJV78DRAFT_420594 [Lactifluus subvellereus]
MNRLVFRPVEAIAGPIFTGLSLRLFTDKLQIDVGQLGESMWIAGERGTADLPPSAEATKTNWLVQLYCHREPGRTRSNPSKYVDQPCTRRSTRTVRICPQHRNDIQSR